MKHPSELESEYSDLFIDVCNQCVENGEYEIILQYTCPKENLGATVEVGGQWLQGTIQTEHESNPIPASILVPHDHYYEKI